MYILYHKDMHKVKLFERGSNQSIIDFQREINQFLDIKANDIEVVDIKFNDVMNENEWYTKVMIHYKED